LVSLDDRTRSRARIPEPEHDDEHENDDDSKNENGERGERFTKAGEGVVAISSHLQGPGVRVWS